MIPRTFLGKRHFIAVTYCSFSADVKADAIKRKLVIPFSVFVAPLLIAETEEKLLGV